MFVRRFHGDSLDGAADRRDGGERRRAHQHLQGRFIVGASGGNGSLRYAGHSYPLSIGGVSLGATIGLSKVELIGNAQGLHNSSDIEGVYSGAGAGLAVASGGRVAKLTNSKGVVLTVKGRQIGFMFSIDLSGMQVSLKK